MSFKRNVLPRTLNKGAELDNDLAGIGIHVACDKPSTDPNIEDTLVAASVDELIDGNSRVLALITNWIELHFERLNVDRLFSIVSSLDPEKYKPVRIYWTAIGQWLAKDRRFQRLATLHKGKSTPLLALKSEPNVTQDLIRRNGEDERFKGTALVVPNLVLTHRPKDIMSAREISEFHMPFRYRVMMGPSFRADMWAHLRREPNATAYKVARETYGSYESARRAKRDYLIVKRDYKNRRGAT